ncbi:T9SS C-terminal target domain-containing protein [Flavobacterium arcticum]|uniref:T9SS C-terminal target domain-containing protein n=1 Tax=Flavobacterium arcticum TaxID=1784713 RepID=A0A345HED2_9FLAO|nr:S8 family peptidase [Flavobacterium arcticum]AXG74942.1 T9SS C-terminal target domain-containing protein [Flavobacterium arcticum]KAF2506495.1 S8 family serine peptidase [Flavobacterium arcticum]
MKSIIITFSLLLSVVCFAQSNNNYVYDYYVQILDKQAVPEVIDTGNGVKLIFKNKELTNIFGQFNITNFEYAFPGTRRELLINLYKIKCEERLIAILQKQYSHIFSGIEEAPEETPLFIPNDYGTIGGALITQPELPFIGAPAAWDITDGTGVTIGIAESMNFQQEDIIGKVSSPTGGSGISGTYAGHGTLVGLVAAAGTNNGIGIASIGYNSEILSAGGYAGLLSIAQNGGRVVNMSWGSCTTGTPSTYGQEVINEVWEDYGVVLVAAAGNGQFSCSLGPDIDHYPASYNHVISITNIGHQYEIGDMSIEQRFWKDIHLDETPPFNATHNVNVDLSAPGRNIASVSSANIANYGYASGTSVAAPLVTGTIGLMFSVNPCLFPEEIESILKLTSYKNDLITENLPYTGRIGAGRLRSDKAVLMAKEMNATFGTVNVEGCITNRWYYVLKTAPYEIKMTNNLVSDDATFDFKAKSNIEILSGDYTSVTGFIDLQIDSTIGEECNVPTTSPRMSKKMLNNNEVNERVAVSKLYPNPNNGTFEITFANVINNSLQVEVYDIYGKVVYRGAEKTVNFNVSIPNLSAGMYIVKLSTDGYTETIKFIKQ